jgi:hypothetical protein
MNTGNPINILDVLIAGIVMANNEELPTRNVNHFNKINGLILKIRDAVSLCRSPSLLNSSMNLGSRETSASILRSIGL